MDLVIEQAKLSAKVTHMHYEGVAGAIAVAVAAAYACRLNGQPAPTRQAFIDMVLPHVPNSIVSERLRHARELTEGASLVLAVAALGNGRMISAQDTVPFDLWCAGETVSNYTDALWLAAAASGDIDTNCAIVGGIVACYTGIEGVPSEWVNLREPLPDWTFED
jgi:ADP-ribosylglycohydrolase